MARVVKRNQVRGRHPSARHHARRDYCSLVELMRTPCSYSSSPTASVWCNYGATASALYTLIRSHSSGCARVDRTFVQAMMRALSAADVHRPDQDVDRPFCSRPCSRPVSRSYKALMRHAQPPASQYIMTLSSQTYLKLVLTQRGMGRYSFWFTHYPHHQLD